jgi:ribonucleotide reductase beta subunit family protein with ferritin-like domain
MSEQPIEPFLQEKRRFTLFPIRHDDIWEVYQKMKALYWGAEEIELSKDLDDWKTLNKDEQHFIKNVLAFFAGSDGLVNVNIMERFIKDVPILEAQFVYSFQGTMENIHSHTYSLLIDTYISSPEEKDHLFNAIETISVVKQKADFAFKYIASEDSFATRLLAFLIFEGIFFSGSFCAIYWLKERNLMPGLTFSNELIARDENLHAQFAVLLYSKLIHQIPEEAVHKMFREAVDIEVSFVCDSIPCRMIGMNSESMTEYIKFVADFWLVELGYSKIYNAKCPFPFMERISMSKVGKANFFEGRVSSYNIASVVGGDSTFEEVTEDF